jgi:hypothetical protein
MLRSAQVGRSAHGPGADGPHVHVRQVSDGVAPGHAEHRDSKLVGPRGAQHCAVHRTSECNLLLMQPTRLVVDGRNRDAAHRHMGIAETG